MITRLVAPLAGYPQQAATELCAVEFRELSPGEGFDAVEVSLEGGDIPEDVLSQLTADRRDHLGRYSGRKAEDLEEVAAAPIEVVADYDVHARAAGGDRMFPRGDDIYCRELIGH